MSYMFNDCSSLTSIDVSGFNTAKVENMSQMFNGCSGITSLDLSGWDTGNVEYMYAMFNGCNKLRTIFAGPAWSIEKLKNLGQAFLQCTSLVGGMGTAYDASHTDLSYARIDGGPSAPGYFTEKGDVSRGDVNGIGGVDMDDLTALINYLLTNDATSINLANAACCNSLDDTTMDMDDLTALINYLLAGSW